MKLKDFFFYWGPVLGWCLLIFILSSIPTLPRVGFIWWDFVMKKSAHILEYALLYFLVWRAITRINFQYVLPIGRFNFQIINKKRKIRLIYWLIPLLFGIIYAISDEYHQSFVMGRTSRLRDVGFDTLGMLLSLWFVRKSLKNK